MKACLKVFFVILTSLSLNALVFGGTELDFQHTFSISSGAKLILKHGDGDVFISPWENDEIDVEVVYSSKNSDDDFKVEFDQRGNQFFVTEVKENRGFSIFHSNRVIQYVYTIRAPSYVILSLSGDDGDVVINSWKANIKCDLDDGDLTLSEINAERTEIHGEDGNVNITGFTGYLQLTTEDGDIQLTDCTETNATLRSEDGDVSVLDFVGDFNLETEDGTVKVDGFRVNSLGIRSEDGDITIGLLEAEGVDISTDDGDVSLRVSRDLPFQFEINTDDGDIQVSLPGGTFEKRGDHTFLGTNHNGTRQFRITTEDGDIRLTGMN